MNKTGSYNEYARAAVEQYAAFDDARRSVLVDAVSHLEIGRVLDVGCGAGQMLIPFLEKTGAVCFGADVAEDLGKVSKHLSGQKEFAGRIGFLRSVGEDLPFADESFDVVLCRLALPYMNNRRAIAEIARVLRPDGVFFLKTHALPFYFNMIGKGLRALQPKQIAYPLICIAGGIFYRLTGVQPGKGFWQGKEIFQTRRQIAGECARSGLRIERELPDTNAQTPSYLIVKGV